MTEKLRNYQVLDVLCGGTFYKVRHKVTSKIFAWKAFNCSAYSDEDIKNISHDVNKISKVKSSNLLEYYDTILHGPSKTMYFVVEYNAWQSVDELLQTCKATDKFISETFIWYLLRELASVCKAVESLQLSVLRKCICASSVFVDETCELKVNCFDLEEAVCAEDVMRGVGFVIRALCCRAEAEIPEFQYSDDLQDVVAFLTDDRDTALRPDVVLYHPTVLANLESMAGPRRLADILVPADYTISDNNKCDSEKAVQLCQAMEPVSRRNLINLDSPIYCNMSPKKSTQSVQQSNVNRGSLSPTLAALALELPGYVPRCRKPLNKAMNCAEKVSDEVFGQQWMSRLIALRQREESLNQRERELIAKEIVNSPTTKRIPLKLDDGMNEAEVVGECNGITLPPVLSQCREAARRGRRRSGSARRGRRRSLAYEDLDSSLSADNGDGSMLVTATKFTRDNMPRRHIFPDNASKKVHFTPVNPFTESDESVTLTFYELDNVDQEGYQLPRAQHTDIAKFKYLDLEKITTEKRSALQWSHSSPSKQAKTSNSVFSDITNQSNMRKTPSKSSLTSKGSNTSRYSISSSKSAWSMESGKVSDNVCDRTRSSMRMSLAPVTPKPEVKKPKTRMSLIPFKTPFKFKTSTKV